MDSSATFLRRVLYGGRVVFDDAPPSESLRTGPALATLKRAHAVARRDLAGPRLPFDADAAVDAAAVFRSAARALVHRDVRPRELLRELRMHDRPATPAAQFSADLFLRFLPHVLTRARRINPSDVLVEALESVLRVWPLSGVLAGLDDGPSGSLDFSGHSGLVMLYAERFVQCGRPAWRPTGSTLAVVELVEQERARPTPRLHGVPDARPE